MLGEELGAGNSLKSHLIGRKRQINKETHKVIPQYEKVAEVTGREPVAEQRGECGAGWLEKEDRGEEPVQGRRAAWRRGHGRGGLALPEAKKPAMP